MLESVAPVVMEGDTRVVVKVYTSALAPPGAIAGSVQLMVPGPGPAPAVKVPPPEMALGAASPAGRGSDSVAS